MQKKSYLKNLCDQQKPCRILDHLSLLAHNVSIDILYCVNHFQRSPELLGASMGRGMKVYIKGIYGKQSLKKQVAQRATIAHLRTSKYFQIVLK